MAKRIISIFLFLIIAALVWYLFLKPSDYIIRFETETFPGAVNQTIKLWDQTLDTVQSVTQGEDIYQLSQKVKFNDSIHSYFWDIESINESKSRVVVGIKDNNLINSINNRIQVPFSKTDFTKRSEKTVLDLMENLKDHISKFKVEIVGETESPSKYLAFVPLHVTQFQKAGGMMKNFNYLTGELFDRGVQFDGPPMVIVNEWDRVNDSIHYDFAQPIIRSEKLPIGTDIEYRRIFPKRALKAVYNGNYITSDRAWYALLDYAEKNNIEVEQKPIEVFFNNPNTGGDEISWKAEIYLPIKTDEE